MECVCEGGWEEKGCGVGTKRNGEKEALYICIWPLTQLFLKRIRTRPLSSVCHLQRSNSNQHQVFSYTTLHTDYHTRLTGKYGYAPWRNNFSHGKLKLDTTLNNSHQHFAFFSSSMAFDFCSVPRIPILIFDFFFPFLSFFFLFALTSNYKAPGRYLLRLVLRQYGALNLHHTA